MKVYSIHSEGIFINEKKKSEKSFFNNKFDVLKVISLNDDKVELNRQIKEQVKLSEEKDEIIVQLKAESKNYKTLLKKCPAW